MTCICKNNGDYCVTCERVEQLKGALVETRNMLVLLTREVREAIAPNTPKMTKLLETCDHYAWMAYEHISKELPSKARSNPR